MNKNITVKATDVDNLTYLFNIMAESYISTTPHGDSQNQIQQKSLRESVDSPKALFGIIKLLLEHLYQPKAFSRVRPVYTSVKIQNFPQIQLQTLPSQALAFLKQKAPTISESHMNELSYFVCSNTSIFTSRKAMDHFLTQTIYVKSFFAVLFNWMTWTTPIEQSSEQPLDDNFIQWAINPIMDTDQLTISQPQKLDEVLGIARELWDASINEQTFRLRLEKFSLMLFPSSSDPSFTNKDYFTQLYQKIFVTQQTFGWAQLFNQKPIFHSIVEFGQQQSGFHLAPIHHNIQRDSIILKNKTAKSAFFYLHKYYLAKDIISLGLSYEQRQQYARSLPFQSYLPRKLGLSLEITLNYQEWFQVFYVEFHDHRPEVLKAARKLYRLLSKQSVQILQKVRGCEQCHLNRLMFIATQKLQFHQIFAQNCEQINYLLNRQITNFATSNRNYESLIAEMKLLLEEELKDKKDINSQTIKLIILKIYKQMHLSDMLPLLIAYLKTYIQVKQPSKNSVKECVEIMKILRKQNGVTDEIIVEGLKLIEKQIKLKEEFKDFFQMVKS